CPMAYMDDLTRCGRSAMRLDVSARCLCPSRDRRASQWFGSISTVIAPRRARGRIAGERGSGVGEERENREFPSLSRSPARSLSRYPTLSRSTESEINRSPVANARFAPEAPIVALDYLLDDCQSSPNSAAEFLAFVQPREDAEDRLVMSLRNPYTVIADVKDRGVGGGEWGVGESERRRQGTAFFPFSLSPCSLISLSPLPTPHPPLPILISLFPSDLDPLQRLVVVFDRVDDQVVEDFAHARVVGSNYRQPPRATNLGSAFQQPRLDHLQRFADDVVEIDFMHGQLGSPDAGRNE